MTAATMSRSISDIKLSLMEGASCICTLIGDADVTAHVDYEPAATEDPPCPAMLHVEKLVTTKEAVLYGDRMRLVIDAGVDIKDLLSFQKLDDEAEAAQIDYERELRDAESL